MKVTEPRLTAALDRPPADIRLYLLHGPDESTAMAFAARLGKTLGAGAERVDLDGATLRGDPARLSDEAAAISLFGDARWIRVTGAGEESVEAVEALLAAEQAGNPAVMIASGVKATGKLVKAAIESDRAMAFACYPPNARDAGGVVNDLARTLGLRIAPAAVQRIVRAADGDRAVMAREVEKLALYLDAAPDRPADADEAALDAIGADIAEGEIGEIVLAATAGEVAVLVEALRRMNGADASPIPILRALGRRLVSLAEMRAAVENGEGIDQVMKRHRVFWKEEAATAAAVRKWKLTDLVAAQAAARRTEREAIALGPAGRVAADAFLLRLARRVG
ncbi:MULTISPECIES: DNA polymerase III subunit delta [Sphingomonas]|uniref:DNA-directed DNA polymerase n=2 Tax=Sphingomonas adhaesiva TaxID=28212 RepID=A0A2A4I6E9_9SPHN|nr:MULTISPECIES: DNA polymerase III subunit delta [Sphingomonas]PCG13708.1 DNA polymerase III subunit delta [Sphingomonas adhaesiva]PZU77909.1 MAG: DNA polymerase III subunit delta [Sphingomonas sp.]